MSTMNMIELENTCCLLDRDHGRDVEDHMQGERRGHIQDWDRDHELNFDQDRAPAGTNGYRTSVDEGKEQRLKRQNGNGVLHYVDIDSIPSFALTVAICFLISVAM
ncbi:hypothetical protein V6N12_071943 [Hibiscus sabdariffa]|uniref:Uncharacterized protein n=1 Tax=Hibiscus sabdariffa TaxID=183260 RepID=A0ABR2FL97_9ROSI